VSCALTEAREIVTAETVKLYYPPKLLPCEMGSHIVWKNFRSVFEEGAASIFRTKQ
jgi:hypothetical protein